MASNNTNINIYVYMDWYQSKEPIFLGTLNSQVIRGKEVFSFENDDNWLRNNLFRSIDPDLSSFPGKQYLPTDKSNFGIFLDSSPDRWGRMLMKRREAVLATQENRKPRPLYEADYLLGVFDESRMGALRFKTDKDGDFMDNNRSFATPPWSSIRDLEYASLQLENEDLFDNKEYNIWLNMLISPGSSLGGARPKASVIDDKGNLWIAKFPSKNDNKDSGAWEAVVAELAKESGIIVSEFMAKKFNTQNNTFLTKRFDRTNQGKRLHFSSAMTLLGYSDGASFADGVSYLEIAEWIMSNCDNTNYNLEQIWRRIVFNISVSNCDDHLRNHGFLLDSGGWHLSPAFDINPDEFGVGLKLNISEDDNSLDYDLALSVSKYFRLDNNKAKEIIQDTKDVVSKWNKVATKYKISRLEQEQVSSAFRY